MKVLLVIVAMLVNGDYRVAQELEQGKPFVHDTEAQCQVAAAERAHQLSKSVLWLEATCKPVPAVKQ